MSHVVTDVIAHHTMVMIMLRACASACIIRKTMIDAIINES